MVTEIAGKIDRGHPAAAELALEEVMFLQGTNEGRRGGRHYANR